MKQTNDNFFYEINERFLQLIENKCFGNKRKFAEIIGFAPQVISNIVSGRKSKPSYDVLNAVLSSFVDISAEWLLTGNGSMLKSEQPQPSAGPVNDKYVAMLEAQLKDKEKINALQEEKIAKLEADIKRLRGKEITAMEDKIELQRQQIQHLTSSMPSVSDTSQRQNLPRF